MRAFSAVFALGALLVLPSFAQPQDTAPPDSSSVLDLIDQQVVQLTEVLDLSGEQQADIREVLIANMEAVLQIRRSYANAGAQGRRDMFGALRAQRRTAEEEINAVLTDEQQARYRAYRNEPRDTRRGNR